MMIKGVKALSHHLFERSISYKQTFKAIEIAVVVLITILFCISMTIQAKKYSVIEKSLDLLMLLCIVDGIIATIIKRKTADKAVFIYTVLYLATRIVSYKLNSIPIEYGGTMMLQFFYLIGVSRHLFGGRKKTTAALYSFIAFDIYAVMLCLFNYHFRPEYVASLCKKYMTAGMMPQTNMFQNPNYAGMMTGAAIVVCFAIIINKKNDRIHAALMIPIIIVNAIMLYCYTGCRSAQIGVVIVVALFVVIMVIKKIDSVRAVIGVSLLISFLSLVPLYTLVYWGPNNNYLYDVTYTENIVEGYSSGRYAIWKTTILSQQGHQLFGFGNSTNAWNKRKELINNADPSIVTETYIQSANHKRQHNGYLALINEAGFVGTIVFLFLLLSRIKNLKGFFRDGQWEKLLLVYIFWINLFEAKFVLQLFFTGFLMMVLLLPSEEDANIV